MPPPMTTRPPAPASLHWVYCYHAKACVKCCKKKYAPQYQPQWGTDIFLAVGALKANPGLVARALDSLEKAPAAAVADTIWNEFLTAIRKLTHADTVCSTMP